MRCSHTVAPACAPIRSSPSSPPEVPDDPDPRRDARAAAFASARALEPTDAEVTAILARAGTAAARPPRRPSRAFARRLAPFAAAAIVLLGGGYAAAEPVRAALDDVAGTFSDWLGGDAGDAPGRPVDSSDATPDYLLDPRYAIEPRVIARAGPYKLFAARGPGNGLTFDLGDTGVALGTPSAARAFSDHAVVVLGTGAMRTMDSRGHVPLFGITARSVSRVELTYASGPPLGVDGVAGGFVLLAEPDRSPRAVVAYDTTGRELGRQLVDDSEHAGPGIDWTQYLPKR